MTQYIEQWIPGILEHGLNTQENASFGGTFAVAGAVTLSSTLIVTGAATFSSTTAGIKRPVTVGTDATYALAATDANRVYIATKTSATQTYTLPVATTGGLVFTFICGHASGEILVTPQTGEAIIITTFAAVGADADTAIVAPAAGTGVKNTAGTNAIGDSMTIVSDGVGAWYGIGITSGIWASQ